jgi:RNA polymerase sigma-70 factor, ECF subfamily
VTIVRSRALDAVRRRGRRDRLDDRAAAEAPVDPVAMGAAPMRPDLATEADNRAHRMRDALATLPEAQREVLALAYYDGLSQAEIADRLTVPLGTVKTRTRLALAKLREALGALAPEESP